MSAHALARQLFAPPGAAAAHTRHLLAQAAGSHAKLLGSTISAHQAPLDWLREAFECYLRGPAPSTEKRFVLDDPQFVEALHALASTSDDPTEWDATVAPGWHRETAEREATIARGRLGNVVAGILLRRNRQWCGQIELATDDYGRIHFPFSDWVLVLADQCDGRRDLLAGETLILTLDEHQAGWSATSQPAACLVRMARQLFDAMFVDNRADERIGGIEFCAGPIAPRFERAARLGRTRIRFEPIARETPAAHAATTGHIVSALVGAMERNAPHIHDQLCQCIRTIHGFELPPYGAGQIASFSIPTSPGVIGFNVQYTANDQPQFSPYAFMWLGHELGHTLHYLIDDVAHAHGWRFLENPGETTPLIARYGRRISVRTLFQIPYVHLFEWSLLMLFHEQDFAGLPWQMFDDTFAVGQDLRQEIVEAFELIDQHARLTAEGVAVVGRMRELAAEAQMRWRQLSFRAARRKSAS